MSADLRDRALAAALAKAQGSGEWRHVLRDAEEFAAVLAGGESA